MDLARRPSKRKYSSEEYVDHFEYIRKRADSEPRYWPNALELASQRRHVRSYSGQVTVMHHLQCLNIIIYTVSAASPDDFSCRAARLTLCSELSFHHNHEQVSLTACSCSDFLLTWYAETMSFFLQMDALQGATCSELCWSWWTMAPR
jgi:hypothetical protein